MHDIPREKWQAFLDDVTEVLSGGHATVEVAESEAGDQVEAIALPFAYLEYDPRDDAVIVAVGRPTSGLPVVFRHVVHHPDRVAVDAEDPALVRSVAVHGQRGDVTIVHLEPKAALPG
ncbi:MAG: hypothetical protein D6683_07910 [Actinomyces sp.]|nr:MAG: hypothetical protein D6683_07910 [Actinomyces sp.]